MVIVVMGAAGTGKSTVGSRLAAVLGWRFYEGDEFHPPANVERMARGKPLRDGDRWPWLDALKGVIDGHRTRGDSAVIACSALKESYRQRLGVDGEAVRLVFLAGPRAVLAERLETRRGHFFGPDLLQSQLDTLEEPRGALRLDVRRPPEELCDEILQAFGLITEGGKAAGPPPAP